MDDIERSYLDRALRGAGIGLWDWALQEDVLTLSPYWQRLLGAPSRTMSPDAWLARVHPLDQQRIYQRIAEAIDGAADELVCEHRLQTRDGVYRWVLVQGTVIRDPSGAATHLSGSMQDLSGTRLHDNLTMLPNRSMMLMVLERMLGTPALGGVICLGIDRFQRVNEIYGHAAGDTLLRHVGAVLSQLLREQHGIRVPANLSHIVASMGDGEFMVLCRHLDQEADLAEIAARLQEHLAGVVPLGAWRFRMSTSAGLRVIANHTASPEAIIRDARAALHRARDRGVPRLQHCAEQHRRAMLRMELEAEMIDALRRDEFVLEYQPVVAMSTGEMVGVEALVRWISPTRGRINPGEFISIAEDTGLIVPLGEWILRTGCRRCATWRRLHGLDIHIAINVSAYQLQQDGFGELVAEVLQQSGLPGTALHLEVTESAFIRDEASIAPLLEQLKELGVTLLLDDFGTGYSALSYLSRLPLDVLKIDRAFVSQMVDDPQAASLTRTIMAMARTLELEVIAEGIETHEQAAHLRALGCELVQGYLYSRPLPEEALLSWAASRKKAA